MDPDFAKYVQDILDSIKLVEFHLSEVKSFKDYI